MHAISVLKRINGTPISKCDQRAVKKYISNEDSILERLAKKFYNNDKNCPVKKELKRITEGK